MSPVFHDSSTPKTGGLSMFSWLAIGSLTHKNFKGKRFNWKSGLTFISSGSNTEIFFAHSRLIIYA